MILLDGNKISEKRAAIIRDRITLLSVTPKIVIVRVGDRADSKSYVHRKVTYAKTVGVETEVVEFAGDVTEEELLSKLALLNTDNEVHGIIVQLPLTKHLNEKNVIAAISPSKDVDGLTDWNASKLMKNEAGIVPATPRGVLTLLREYEIEVTGKHIVVVGRSLLVGKSVALLMLNNDATVTMCHSKTEIDSEAMVPNPSVALPAVLNF